MNDQEPIFDVAQLAHVELLTPKPDETLWFFKGLLGLQETARRGQSVYLRGYEESYHHSLKITEAAAPGLGHVAWRSTSPQPESTDWCPGRVDRGVGGRVGLREGAGRGGCGRLRPLGRRWRV